MNGKTESTHGHYLLMLSVAGAAQDDIDAAARDISDAYMREFGSAGALTVAVLQLGDRVAGGSTILEGDPWTMLIRYFGPTYSVGWLQTQLEDRARELDATLQTITFEVRDVTGVY